MVGRHSFFHGELRLLFAAGFATVMTSVRADVDVSEYDPRASVSDREAQQSYRRQIEIDRQAEARRAIERLREEERAEAECRHLEEAHPWPARTDHRFEWTLALLILFSPLLLLIIAKAGKKICQRRKP